MTDGKMRSKLILQGFNVLHFQFEKKYVTVLFEIFHLFIYYIFLYTTFTVQMSGIS